MSTAVFKKFSKNPHGRCFVVGDIHGAFNSVLDQMDAVNFDLGQDRLFCVGDLVDRGADSAAVLDFLALPFVHAVRGNHDTEFMQLPLEHVRTLGRAHWQGMGWVNDATDEVILAIQAAFAELPIAMEIETDRGSVGIVHADVPKGMDWETFVNSLEAGDPKTVETALWGRSRIKSADTSGVPGIDRLYVGHSIQWGGPKKLGNVYHIDSGAVFKELSEDRGVLNMIHLAVRTESLTQTMSRAGLYPDSGDGPFGNYSLPSSS